jgi:isoleucyl-tRNA synthetase
VKEVATALAADDGSLAASLARGERVTVGTSSGEVSVGPDDVDLTQETPGGWGMAAEGGLTVAIELEPTEELRLEGLARELVRLVQDARKAAALEITDRIELGIQTTGDLARALAAHRDEIAGETLAISLIDEAVDGTEASQEASIEGRAVTISLRKA